MYEVKLRQYMESPIMICIRKKKKEACNVLKCHVKCVEKLEKERD